MQKRGAQQMQPADRSIQQAPDDRLSGRIPRQLIQVTLNGGRGLFLTHGAASKAGRGCIQTIIRGTLTIGAGITVRRNTGTINGSAVINQGTIATDMVIAVLRCGYARLSPFPVNSCSRYLATDSKLADRDSSRDSPNFKWQVMAASGRKSGGVSKHPKAFSIFITPLSEMACVEKSLEKDHRPRGHFVTFTFV
jgi:hypothetical protein